MVKKLLKNWKIAPPPIPDSKIEAEYTADTIVVGLGSAGTAAARAAAEAGASVIAIEKMGKKQFKVLGEQVGHINSKFLAGKGVPAVDPVEFFNEWMQRSGNRANPKLIMQFCRNCGDTFDWFIGTLTTGQKNSIEVTYWPTGKHFHGEISGQKFWAGTAAFKGRFSPEAVGLSVAIKANQASAARYGAKLHFGMDARQLILDSSGVVGVIAENTAGQYIRYRAHKGVILAAGDFSGNQEMCEELLPDIFDVFEDNEKLVTFGRDGSGIQMAVWAGGRLEARPIAAMGGNCAMVQSVLGSFGTLWVDAAGKRFCNESFGDPVFAALPGAQEKHTAKTVVFDSGIFEDLESGPPAHTAFYLHNQVAEKELRDNMAAAGAGGAKGHQIRHSTLYSADTLNRLADYAGFKNSGKQHFLDTVRNFNTYCLMGRDDEFGKDPRLLHALDRPPFFAETVNEFRIGWIMVTCGGLLTDEYQNVLNHNRDPIRGLYATGNCCGRRFGTQYSTPVAGVSIGIAMTLGREVGKIVAKLPE